MPVLGSRFQPLPVSFWGRSKNKSGSKYGVIPRVRVWSRGFEIFRRCVITLGTLRCQRVWRSVGEGSEVALCLDEILMLSRVRRISQISIRTLIERISPIARYPDRAIVSDLDQSCRTSVLYLVEPIGTFGSEFGGRGPHGPV
ncbi:hypothetical protein L3X38_023096 [Prunus dulcis]|uniref:Uncharacterized protein n=1 Tax=Prunus dulcis TaxID=3755 RepID=A0AAD4VZ68_PRUDU|nr:hypothetical protein L3X38_023096 [Prunus dulcis]